MSVIRTIDSTPTDMYERESTKRLIEGLKLSASCAREMYAQEPRMGWHKVVESLNGLIISARKLAQTRAMTRQALLADADRIQSKLGPKLEA